MFGFGGYSPFGGPAPSAAPQGYFSPGMSGTPFNPFSSYITAGQLGAGMALPPGAMGAGPGPNGPTIPQSSSGGFQNAPTQPPSSGGFDLGGAPAGAYQLPGYSPSNFGFSGVREPPNLSNGRDLYGAVAPRPQDQPMNPWNSNAGPTGYGPGAYNPWMSNLGAQGAMGMMNASPFTGYFNNMAYNNVGAPNYDPNTLNQTQSYAGIRNHLQNAWAQQRAQQQSARAQAGAPKQNVGGISPWEAAAGAAAFGAATGNPYLIPLAAGVGGAKRLIDSIFG